MHAAFAMRDGLAGRMFAPEDLEHLAGLVEIDLGLTITDFASADPGLLAGLDILVTGWGAPLVDADALARMPRLAAICHTAGTVKSIASPAVWERGITVTNAAAANAVPVADYTLAMILLAGKQVLQSARSYRERRPASYGIGGKHDGPGAERLGNYGKTIGIIGASMIGRMVIERLRDYPFEVLLYDPYLDARGAEALGARSVGLEELFASSDIVTLHAPDTAETRGMVTAELLASLREGATFLNTARPALVDHDALRRVLAAGKVFAVLDVTTPEPLPADDPLWEMPNVLLTPHWAGSQGTELHRMGASALADLTAIAEGREPEHVVRAEELSRMA